VLAYIVQLHVRVRRVWSWADVAGCSVSATDAWLDLSTCVVAERRGQLAILTRAADAGLDTGYDDGWQRSSQMDLHRLLACASSGQYIGLAATNTGSRTV
jgi:hypothetical protein